MYYVKNCYYVYKIFNIYDEMIIILTFNYLQRIKR